MLESLLFLFALVAVVLSSFAWVTAPPRPGWWKAAIAAGEFGHLFALLPFGVAGLAGLAIEGWSCVVLLVLCGVAAAGLLRPAWTAWRMGARLPAELARSFGPGHADGAAAVFAFARLLVAPAAARVPVATETFARHADVELRLDFYRAAGAGPAPCLVVVHGGGWDGGDRAQLAEWNHRWAARGYAVAAVSYRLAPRHPWPAQREDLGAALAWLKANAARLGIDPARFVLIGRSAGGQIAAAVGYGAQDPAIVGVVSFYAPHDMPFAWSVSREDDALNTARLMRQYLGGPPDTPERAALYASASAQFMVGSGTPPTLLLHGRPDTVVWHRHSERLAARLREAGVRHHHLALPWATHGFDFNPDGPGGQLADFAIGRFLDCVCGAGGRGA